MSSIHLGGRRQEMWQRDTRSWSWVRRGLAGDFTAWVSAGGCLLQGEGEDEQRAMLGGHQPQPPPVRGVPPHGSTVCTAHGVCHIPVCCHYDLAGTATHLSLAVIFWGKKKKKGTIKSTLKVHYCRAQLYGVTRSSYLLPVGPFCSSSTR